MKPELKPFLIRLSLLTIVLMIMAMVLIYTLPEGFVSPSLPFVILYFFFVTLIVHVVTIKATRHSPRQFISYFMATTFIKFFLYVVTVLGYVYFFREDLIPFVISFFVLYIIYTIFEVVSFVGKTID